MLQRNPNLHPHRRAGIIGACVVSGVAIATLVVALERNADDGPSSPSPATVAAAAAARQQAIEDAAGSDHHLELLAAELAEQAATRQQAIEDAASDREVELSTPKPAPQRR